MFKVVQHIACVAGVWGEGGRGGGREGMQQIAATNVALKIVWSADAMLHVSIFFCATILR